MAALAQITFPEALIFSVLGERRRSLPLSLSFSLSLSLSLSLFLFLSVILKQLNFDEERV